MLAQYWPATTQPLLDLGCGEGFDVRALRAQGAATGTVVGVDADLTALRDAARSGALHAVCASATHLPFGDGTLPGAVCLEVLEHLDQPAAALQELGRASGSLLLLSVPHQPHFSIANFLCGKNWPTLGDDPDHRHAWRPAAFLELVRHGAEIVDVRFSFPWLIVVARPRKS